MRRARRPGLLAKVLPALTFAAVLGWATPSLAQPTPPPPSAPEDLADRAPFHIGPFYFQPWIALTHAGYDTNVFNDYQDPKSDFTFTLTPALDGGMRAGAARLNFRLLTDLVWFRTYTSERGDDGHARVQFELRYDWLRPYVAAEWTNTRSRPGYEVDARAERNIPAYEGGVDVRIASRTWIVTSYRQIDTQFLAGEIYEGQPLDQALNNTTRTATAGLRFELTPFTDLSLLGQAQQVRFDSAAFRDNDNVAFLPTLDFKPDALVSGRAAIGYRALTAKTAGVPDFSGLVLSVGLKYVLASSTSLGVGAERDVAYSFEDSYPYYLLSGVSGSIAQQLVRSLEATGQFRLEWLNYSVVTEGVSPRTDTVTLYGLGCGYRFGDFARLGFDVEWVRRRSDLPEREYQGIRSFGSLRYGF